MPPTKPSSSWLLGTAFLAGILVGVVLGVGLAPRETVVVQSGDAAARAEYVAQMASDDHFLGDADAPVTIVEFSDFQCPFCRRHALSTIPEIKENFIDTGKVKYVYRDFTSPNESYHPGGYVAAQAAECAGDQGLYWELWNMIFEEQEALAPGRTVAFGWDEIQTWATSVEGLDIDTLKSCVTSGEKIAEIDADTQDGLVYGVQGTPAVFVQGVPLSGAQPYPVFAAAIERSLAGIE